MFARPNGANKAEMSQIKAQFKKADASGALYALVFAGDEMAKNGVSVKNLRDRDAQQLELPITDLVSWAQSQIKK
jgi:histidyl-tRNA synthetase